MIVSTKYHYDTTAIPTSRVGPLVPATRITGVCDAGERGIC